MPPGCECPQKHRDSPGGVPSLQRPPFSHRIMASPRMEKTYKIIQPTYCQ